LNFSTENYSELQKIKETMWELGPP
jgi:hypothetical protein